MIVILPTEVSDITKIQCPSCGEKVRSIGLLKGSRVDGLTFKCRKCGKLWRITTT